MTHIDPKLPQDNDRVNRADEKFKLVKTESDTMGGHDHPTTGPTPTIRTIRFNALLSRQPGVSRFGILTVDPTRVEIALLSEVTLRQAVL